MCHTIDSLAFRNGTAQVEGLEAGGAVEGLQVGVSHSGLSACQKSAPDPGFAHDCSQYGQPLDTRAMRVGNSGAVQLNGACIPCVAVIGFEEHTLAGHPANHKATTQPLTSSMACGTTVMFVSKPAAFVSTC